MGIKILRIAIWTIGFAGLFLAILFISAGEASQDTTLEIAGGVLGIVCIVNLITMIGMKRNDRDND